MKGRTKKVICCLWLFPLIFLGFPLIISAQTNEFWKWKYQTPDDSGFVIFKQFHQGIVYLEEFSVENKQFLAAFEAKTRKLKWRVQLQEKIETNSNSNISKIEFGAGKINVLTRDRHLFVLNQQNGKLLWQSRSETEKNSFFINLKSHQTGLFTLVNEIGLLKNDLQNGSEKWSFKRCLNVGYESNNNLVVKENSVIFPCGSGKLYAVDSVGGFEKWRKNYGRGVINYLFEADGIIFALVGNFDNDTGVVQALNAENGNLLWEDKISGRGRIYLNAFKADKDFCFFYHKDSLIKYEAKTGKKLWSQPALSRANTVGKSFLTNREIVEYNSEGWISAISLDTGKVLWKTQISEDSRNRFNPKHLEIIGDKIFLSVNGELLSISLLNGAVLWKIKSLAELKGSDKIGTLFFETALKMVSATDVLELEKSAHSNSEVSIPSEIKKLAESQPVIGMGSGRGIGSGTGNRFNISPNRNVSVIGYQAGKVYYLETFIKQRKVNLNEINVETGEQKILVRGLEGGYLNVPRIYGKVAYLSGIFSKNNSRYMAKVGFSNTRQQTGSPQLWAVDLESDQILWKYDVSLRTNTNIIASDDKVFLTDSSGTVHALDQNGKPIWKQVVQTRSFLREPKLLTDEGQLFLLTLEESEKSKISAFSPQTGEVLWTIDRDFPINDFWIKENLLYFANRQGGFFAIDRQTGKEVWAEKFHSPVYNVKINGDNLFVSHLYNGWLTSLNRTSGDLNWERRFDTEKVDFIDDDELFSFKDGWLLNTKTGERKEKLPQIYHPAKMIMVGNKDFVVYLEQDDGKSVKENHPSEPHQDLIKFDLKNNKIVWSIAL